MTTSERINPGTRENKTKKKHAHTRVVGYKIERLKSRKDSIMSPVDVNTHETKFNICVCRVID